MSLDRAGRALLALAAVVGVAFIITYLVTALLRLRYPFELEWMEGATVDHVRRALAGKALYVAPTVDFVPFIYTPLYYYVSAGVVKLTGIGFLPLRLVSLLSSLGCFVLLSLMARRESGSRLVGLLAAGFFAATYSLSGAWWDIARVDTLSLLLLLGALSLLRPEPTPRRQVAAALLFCLAFWTKQQALVVALPVAVALALQLRRKSLPFLTALVLPLLLGHVLLDWLHGGWYSFYTLRLPRAHAWYPPALTEFWFGDLLPVLAGMIGLGAAYLIAAWRHGRRAEATFYLAALLGALAAGWGSRLHVGGYVNVLMPAHAVLALVGALGVGAAFAMARKGRAKWLSLAACALCLVQFALLLYSPSRYLPAPRDAAAGRALVTTLAAIPGEVWVQSHGYLPTFAGKRTYAHSMAVADVLRGGDPQTSAELRRSITQAYAAHRFSALVLDRTLEEPVVYRRFYREERAVSQQGDAFSPVTGNRVRPEVICVPR